MLVQKNEIVLSPKHPSLLENDFRKSDLYAPVIVNQDSALIDGYRRYRMEEKQEILAVQMDLPGIYDAALEMNRNTRVWDEIDVFLWVRWAISLGTENSGFPQKSYPKELSQAPVEMLSALANRRLQLGQLVKILQTPSSTWRFFAETLSSSVRLNVNETADFIDLTFDLANRWQTKNLSDVLQNPRLHEILADERFGPRQAGEALLKEMRSLRYPLYQRKTEELSTAWKQLNLERWQAKKGQFLDRGVLEITIRARSQVEMSKQVRELFESLSLPAWKGLWEVMTRKSKGEIAILAGLMILLSISIFSQFSKESDIPATSIEKRSSIPANASSNDVLAVDLLQQSGTGVLRREKKHIPVWSRYENPNSSARIRTRSTRRIQVWPSLPRCLKFNTWASTMKRKQV